MPDVEVRARLRELGFSQRELRPFQLRDLSRLIRLSNGANFSVPGAGKTTVTLALHLLTRSATEHLLVVAPRSAFQAWLDVIEECIEKEAGEPFPEPFTVLDGDAEHTQEALISGRTRFIITYEAVVRDEGIVAAHMVRQDTHLVLDESHRMKAGWQSRRGSSMLSIATIPVRRDILTGPPMPQTEADVASQLDFLWPGHGLGLRVIQGEPPARVMAGLYVRTTKSELGLPEPTRAFVNVDMNAGQLALYAMVRQEFVRAFSVPFSDRTGGALLRRARRSVMRLLQLSVNPVLALNAMSHAGTQIESGVVDQVLDEGHSAKMRAVMAHARALAEDGRKSVIWTIFTDTIHSFTSSLADLNAVYIHGAVPPGSALDPDSREGKVRRFLEDDECFVLIANPATAGEGINLHTACHDAIYADRSYVSTHYIQSIDRIHRLGLPPEAETNIFVYRSKAPPTIGSIDLSVSRRLTEKVRNMERLLDDVDLRQLALDEEEAAEPIDYGIDIDDIADLIMELETGEKGETATGLQ